MQRGFLLSVLIGVHLWFSSFCAAVEPTTKPSLIIGRIDSPLIPESSGIVASRKYPGVFWTHNDSGNDAAIFAVTREGKLIARYPVAATNLDWEDIATDDAGSLYIAEIGNNNARRRQIGVYRVTEPDPHQPRTKNASPLKIEQTWRLQYPGDPFDAEALFVWKDHGYVISKMFDGSEAGVYRFDLSPQEKPAVLEPVTRLPVRSPVTAADLSADGDRLAVQTMLGPFLFEGLKGDINSAGRIAPRQAFHLDPTMEGVCFADGGLLATSENQNVYLFREADFGKAAPRADRPATRIDIPRATTRPAIDGDLADWDLNSPVVPMLVEPGAIEPARLWARWSAEGLYLAAVVPQGKPTPLAEAWFTGDVMEIFVGEEKPDRGGDYEAGDDRCYVGFTKSPSGDCGDATIVWPRRENGRVDGSRAAGRINAGVSYQLEVFVPLAELSAGRRMRLNVSILARHPRRNWFISESNAMGTWLSPTTWAVATLREK